MSRREHIEIITKTRSIARKLARELHPEELNRVSAGTITMDGPGRPGDCDTDPK
jgi:hypothetical protein